MKIKLLLVWMFCLLGSTGNLAAQAPVVVTKKNTAPKATDSNYRKYLQQFNPRKATMRSAIIPGWGQIYNRKYWKLPLVYGALGTTAGIFFFNISTYNSLKQAYANRLDGDDSNNGLINPDFRTLSTGSLKTYRDSYRQNVDYSVLFFLLFWGLNVVDATVDAHLKLFDVNDDLSFRLKPGYSPLANTTGISLVLNLSKKNYGK